MVCKVQHPQRLRSRLCLRCPADGWWHGYVQQHQGCRRGVGYRVLGSLDAPVNNYIDITTPYAGRFGAPEVGKRVFVSVNANINGYEGIPLVFSARVPTAA